MHTMGVPGVRGRHMRVITPDIFLVLEADTTRPTTSAKEQWLHSGLVKYPVKKESFNSSYYMSW